MKIRIAAVAIAVLLSTFAWAQSSTPQTPPAGSQAGSGAGEEKSTMPAGTMQGGSQSQMRTQRMQAMQGMQQDLAKMRALLDQMKASTATMTGKEKSAMQANVQLWQMMIDHMSAMSQHMSEMQGSMGGPGMGGMHHHHQMNGPGMNGSGTQGPEAAPPKPPDSNNPPPPPQR